jgi:hypothetical protein
MRLPLRMQRPRCRYYSHALCDKWHSPLAHFIAQLVERCRCLVDSTPDAIKFTVDRVWKAADSASSGQVLPLLP